MEIENIWCCHSLKPQDTPWELVSQWGPPIESWDIRNREEACKQEEKSWRVPRNYKDTILKRPALVSVHLLPTNISGIQHRSNVQGSMANGVPYVTVCVCVCVCVCVMVDGCESKLSVSLHRLQLFQFPGIRLIPLDLFTYFWPL